MEISKIKYIHDFVQRSDVLVHERETGTENGDVSEPAECLAVNLCSEPLNVNDIIEHSACYS